jgi:hypothetical protein
MSYQFSPTADKADLGPITPALKKLQEKYVTGQMDIQAFLFSIDSEVQKFAREREEQQNC